MPYLVLAILYFVCTAIEIFGIAAAYRASVPLVRAYFWAAATSAVVVSACEVVRTTLHFTKKGEIVAACIDSYSTDVARGTYSNSDVSSFCNDSWRNSSYVSSFSLPGRRHLQQLTQLEYPHARAHTHTHTGRHCHPRLYLFHLLLLRVRRRFIPASAAARASFHHRFRTRFDAFFPRVRS
jgi:hypothetical protein